MHQNKKYFILIILTLLLTSCIDFTPDFVESQTISFDENMQNSGIIDFYNDDGYIVTSNFIKRYNYMMNIEIINEKDEKIKLKEFFIPPLEKNFGVQKLENSKYYIINNQGMQNFLLMNNIRKMYHNTY